MKRTDYTPLNIIEKMNSKISLLCSIAALVILVLLFYRLDKKLLQKPAEESQSVEMETEKTRETQTQTDQAAESEQTGQSEQSEQSGQTEQTAAFV